MTNLQEAKESEIVSIYVRRWGIELTIKELKGGLHLGQMQVSKQGKRVEKAVTLSVMAYLPLVSMYGREEGIEKEMNIFKLKQRFTAEVFQEQMSRREQRWREKLDRYRLAA